MSHLNLIQSLSCSSTASAQNYSVSEGMHNNCLNNYSTTAATNNIINNLNSNAQQSDSIQTHKSLAPTHSINSTASSQDLPPVSPRSVAFKPTQPCLGQFSNNSSGFNKPSSVPTLLIDDADIPPQNCFRLVLLGSSRVGKTSIVSRFLSNRFDERYTPTIEDFHRKIYRIRGEAYRLDILDTSGNDPFPAMKRLSLLTGDLFIIVYSVDSRESFEEAARLREQVLRTKKTGMATSKKNKPGCQQVTSIVIVGNKCENETDRVVETTELNETIERSGTNCCGLEASAKKNFNIEEIFNKLFQLAKLPAEMSPSMHRSVQPTYVAQPEPQLSGRSGNRRLMSLRRRLSEACGAVAINARRPSIRTDLMSLQRSVNTADQKNSGDCNRDMFGKSCLIQ